MARGFTLATHARPTSTLLFNSFIAGHSSKWVISKSVRRSICQPKVRPFLRFSCNCAAPQTLIDMSRYNEIFSKRMAKTGLKPHHRIALGVSGGPDSMALCVLAANWKASSRKNIGEIDGLLAIIVDHGLRPESGEEAILVSHRVSEMGIGFELARCEWPNGKPKQGHVQEAAREMRYQKFQEVCIRNGISVLLVAHHADDQAELFILRLSRNSGVLGLAGMAFYSQLFSSSLPRFCGSCADHDVLLVRPLLDLSKEDMYKICEGGGSEWVEDPTNQSQLYARNRIRKSLRQSSSMFDRELQAVIHACRDTRLYVDQICQDLIKKAVTIMPYGYASVDLELLSPSKIAEICLLKFLALVLQFVSQRHRPVRGSTAKLLLDYMRTFPCKTSVTAAGCYLCPAPGSKGTKMLVCCSVNHPLPSKLELIFSTLDGKIKHREDELEKILADGKSSSNHSAPDAEEVRFLDVPSDHILLVAKRLKILSEASYNIILRLQKEETQNFKRKTGDFFDLEQKQEDELKPFCDAEQLHSGNVYYFMKRFFVKFQWNSQITTCGMHSEEMSSEGGLETDKTNLKDAFCVLRHDKIMYLRPMIDTDWLYLAKLLKWSVEEFHSHVLSGSHDATGSMEMMMAGLEYARMSAHRSLLELKKIPVAARRALPVLIDGQDKLLAIPSTGFQQCPCFTVQAEYKPRVPLGGGHSSFN